MARGFDPAPRWLLSAALSLGLCGCPHQELAPLLPCTVSIVSVDAAQSGTDQVDLLFVIDNSASMSEEQVKLNQQLARLVRVLTSGDFDGMPNANGQPDFRPVGSLRLGVVSSDLGANGVPGVWSCGTNSFQATEQNISVQGVDNVDRPFGDDGLLLNSTAVAVAGVSVTNPPGVGAPMVAIAPRPECAVTLPRMLEYPGGGDAETVAAAFSCMSELGANGCAIEQQLESMWKSMAPSTDRSFSRGSAGQGLPMGLNAGFLRPEAILAVILVTDEEDCSSPDNSAPQVYSSLDVGTINGICGRNQNLLHPVARYVTGLKSLKPEALQDYIIFGGIVGVPLNSNGQSFEQILARPEMRFQEAFGLARAVCTAADGSGTATPARRIVEVAQGFGENGVITSICENDYAGALDAIIGKIAGKLSGQCLPRSLKRNSEGRVECRVVEIKHSNDRSPCDPARGRIRQLPDRYLNGANHTVCEMAQLAVTARAEPPGVGWYYDDFSGAIANCGGDNQRIAFTNAAAIEDGSSARFECYRSVAEVSSPSARGADAINTSCAGTGGPRGQSGQAQCRAVSTAEFPLTCVDGICQLACMNDSDCPPGRACTATGDTAAMGHCENPICPLETAGL